MEQTPTPDWVERVLDDADRLADRQAQAREARRRVEAMDARLSTVAEEIGVALLSLLFFGTTLFALAFVNV